MARIYATAADYKAYTGDEAATATLEALRNASVLVGHATRFAGYPSGEDGKPTNADHIEAFTDAVCAQVAHWQSRDDATGLGTAKGDLSSLTIKGLSWTRDKASVVPAGALSPTARQILDIAGLTTIHLAR